MPFSPELLLPAGSVEKMRAAYDFGADAVYAGQPRYSLRARNNEFSTYEALKEGIDEAHRRGKQFYVASNIYAHNSKLKTYLDDMAPVIDMKPDALIMHPGPINRDVEITSEVADGPNSVILEQVTNGLAVRMAVLFLVAGCVQK